MSSPWQPETAFFYIAFLSQLLTSPTYPAAISQAVGTFANKTALPSTSLQPHMTNFCVRRILPQFSLHWYSLESSGSYLRMRILPPSLTTFLDSFPSYHTSSCSTFSAIFLLPLLRTCYQLLELPQTPKLIFYISASFFLSAVLFPAMGPTT